MLSPERAHSFLQRAQGGSTAQAGVSQVPQLGLQPALVWAPWAAREGEKGMAEGSRARLCPLCS